MIDFIFKHLIKNYQDIDNKKVRNKYAYFCCILGILINFIIFLLELTIGLFTGSSAILTNAFHDLTDSVASIISIIGFKLSNKPADNEHKQGYGRFEYLSACLTSIIICFIGIEFIKSAFITILNPQTVKFNIVTIIIILCTIPLKSILSYVLHKIAKMIDSDSLLATATDCRNDIFILSGIILSILISYFLKINIDRYISMAIAIFILISGIASLKESIEPLLGEAPDIKLINNINKIVFENKNIISVHDLIVHNYGINTNLATIHVVMKNNLTLIEADKEVEQISNEIKNKLNVDLLIHIDVEDENDDNKKENKNHIVKLGLMRKWFN